MWRVRRAPCGALRQLRSIESTVEQVLRRVRRIARPRGRCPEVRFPRTLPPKHLAEEILTSKSALEGELEFVTAARALGGTDRLVVTRHILPNSLPPLIVQTTLAIAFAILQAAALGFLGLGAQPPTLEWGAMLADSYKYFTSGARWVFFFPGAAIMLSVLGFNLRGDGLRDALDPRLRSD